MNTEAALGAFGARGGTAAQVDALGGPGRGGGTRRLAEAWAEASGKSVSSQMRAVQRALRAGRPPARQDRGTANAGAGRVAAERLRSARSFRGGTVVVVYNGRPQGTRDLGSLDVSGMFAADLRGVADLLEDGRHDEAAERFSEAVLDEYGNLGGTLSIEEFETGFDVQG